MFSWTTELIFSSLLSNQKIKLSIHLSLLNQNDTSLPAKCLYISLQCLLAGYSHQHLTSRSTSFNLEKGKAQSRPLISTYISQGMDASLMTTSPDLSA